MSGKNHAFPLAVATATPVGVSAPWPTRSLGSERFQTTTAW